MLDSKVLEQFYASIWMHIALVAAFVFHAAIEVRTTTAPVRCAGIGFLFTTSATAIAVVPVVIIIIIIVCAGSGACAQPEGNCIPIAIAVMSVASPASPETSSMTTPVVSSVLRHFLQFLTRLTRF